MEAMDIGEESNVSWRMDIYHMYDGYARGMTVLEGTGEKEKKQMVYNIKRGYKK